jgi:hypothetical protein
VGSRHCGRERPVGGRGREIAVGSRDHSVVGMLIRKFVKTVVVPRLGGLRVVIVVGLLLVEVGKCCCHGYQKCAWLAVSVVQGGYTIQAPQESVESRSQQSGQYSDKRAMTGDGVNVLAVMGFVDFRFWKSKM